MKVKSPFKFLYAITLTLTLLLTFSLFSQNWRTCIRVVDGDTIVLDGNERVRLIGVDTPETQDPRKPVQYFGKEAYEFTKNLVEGKKVRLEYDQNKKDKYDRTLAYIFLEDGTFLNVRIPMIPATHSERKRPPVGAKRRWALIMYPSGRLESRI